MAFFFYFNSLHDGNPHAFLSSNIFFKSLIASKRSFRYTISVSNSLDPGQARRSVGPDLNPVCCQNLSPDKAVASSNERAKQTRN